ncbi:MAG: molecular chaperone DnaJ, partial [Cyanobium sp.]
MELPIDHFRLLGVSPSTDAQTVLRTLQQRLDRPPDQGFTHECLEARAHLLRTTADLLTDEPRRRAYEDQLLSLEAGDNHVLAALEVASSHEVGG